LQAFARRLGRDRAVRALERPFVHYVGNNPPAAAHHFHGLREAIPGLKGIALFDRLEPGAPDNPCLEHAAWRQREIENYLCTETTLMAYARASATTAEPMPLFSLSEAGRRAAAMQEAIAEIGEALDRLGKGSPWGNDIKASDEFLTPLFKAYFRKIDIPNLMEKKSFHALVDHVPEGEIDPEIGEKLDAIAAVAESAAPAADD